MHMEDEGTVGNEPVSEADQRVGVRCAPGLGRVEPQVHRLFCLFKQLDWEPRMLVMQMPHLHNARVVEGCIARIKRKHRPITSDLVALNDLAVDVPQISHDNASHISIFKLIECDRI